MRDVLRFTRVQRTPDGADSGIDVRAVEGVAQVKWYRAPVGIADVQRLRGTATGGRWAVFYASLSGYTKAGQRAAADGNVALFTIGPLGGAYPDNHVARWLLSLRQGLPTAPAATRSLGETMATSRRIWELNAVLRPFVARVDKLCDARDEMLRTAAHLDRDDPDGEALVSLRSRFGDWLEEDGAPDLDAARVRVHAAANWATEFPLDQMEGDRAPIIEYLERSAAIAPEIVEQAIQAVPLPRDQVDEWADEWIAAKHKRELTPRLDHPSAVHRQIAQRLADFGPDRSTLERHAAQRELRVVS